MEDDRPWQNRDWPEAQLEQERVYQNICWECKQFFFGFRTRGRCYACVEKH